VLSRRAARTQKVCCVYLGSVSVGGPLVVEVGEVLYRRGSSFRARFWCLSRSYSTHPWGPRGMGVWFFPSVDCRQTGLSFAGGDAVVVPTGCRWLV